MKTVRGEKSQVDCNNTIWVYKDEIESQINHIMTSKNKNQANSLIVDTVNQFKDIYDNISEVKCDIKSRLLHPYFNETFEY